MGDPELSLAEHACLALVAEGAEHGWAIVTLLAPDGELGRVWSLSRPLTYRAIESLAERGLIAKRGTAHGRGRDRTLLRVTRAGKRAVAAWLDRPVVHVRDVRTELLLKLVLRQRAGLPIDPLVVAQQSLLAPAIDTLTAARAPGDVVALWRSESADAVRRFLDAVRGS